MNNAVVIGSIALAVAFLQVRLALFYFCNFNKNQFKAHIEKANTLKRKPKRKKL